MSREIIKEYGINCLIALVVLVTALGLLNFSGITGFAVLEENETANEALNESSASIETTSTDLASSNETPIAINETQETKEKEKPEKDEKIEEKPKKAEPNKPPVWKSDVNEFTIYGKTAFDLNNYFYDDNNDTITYTSTIPDKISVEINNNIAILTPLESNFTTTIEFTASDGDKSTTKEAALIVPERSIAINLQYKPSSYDIDENGYEPIEGIIDFTVENSKFSWNVNESNLCAKWDVYSVEEVKSTTVCYGSEKCCAFIGLAPSRDSWSEPFYSTYGQYGATLNNIVSSQVIYVDYGVRETKPYVDIYYSQWQNLSANYYFSSIDFENVCVDTCILAGFNESGYKIIIEIDNAILNIDALTYSIVEQISKVLIDLGIKDDLGFASGVFNLYKNSILVPIVENFVEPDYYDIEITPNEELKGTIEKIVIENANLTKPISASIGIDNVTKDVALENVEVKKKYAVDLEELEFEKATLTANATANALYKCRLWDYEREQCFGTWEKVKDLAVGEAYNLTLTNDDPGFIEGNINITPANISELNITNLTQIFLIKDIPNITIAINSNTTINLSDYFSNIDENTIFTYFEQDDITILFDNHIATIAPAQDFVGTTYTYITATEGTSAAISNLFSINVVNITAISNITANVTVNITPNLMIKKKDFKLYEDIDVDFEYLTKQELIKEEKWKDEYEVYEDETEKTEDELKLLREKIIKKEKQFKKHIKENETIEAFVLDANGDLKDIGIEIEELREGKFKVKLPKPRAFKAGKYTLKIDLVKDGITYTQEQDFTWGVLAINVNKSIYLPNQDAFIGIGVLDDKGKIVCNADVTLEIINPSNQKTILTTANNGILISPECAYLGVTELPDYYTTYSVNGIGTYLMNLTAATSNGIRSILDNFTVQNSVSFDVARKGPTRIYPLVPYKMEFTINANDDYSGPIIEYVPSSFAITPQQDIIVNDFGNEKQIIWIEDFAKDNSYKLSFEFDAPDISPEFYVLGPLEIGAFKESRQWQIASDQAADVNVSFPDAGAPGMNLVVQFVGTGFISGDSVTVNSSGNITVGPIVVTDANGDRVDSSGRVLSTVFYIHPNATAQDVKITVGGQQLPSVFKIINATAKKNSGNFTGAAAGKYMIGDGKNGTRTVRGTIVLDSLIIPSNVIVIVNTTDLDPNLVGDQGYLPVHIIVDGPVNISGTLNISGLSGSPNNVEGGGKGGHGGPGGGGGGAAGGDDGGAGTMGSGGNGFTGGGGGGCESGTGCAGGGAGGNGTGSFGGAVSAADGGGGGGNSTSPKAVGGLGSGVAAVGAGGGGGTGFFFGSGGAGSGGAGGQGGGGGAPATSSNHGSGGGFGTAGGSGSAATGGSAHGSSQLIPLTGGSGGGGGAGHSTGNGGGGGGGGGGGVLIFAKENITIMPTGQILALGGNGFNTGSGDGGGGSGGGIVLQASNVSLQGALNTSAGTAMGGSGGTGGMGRIRIDGLDNPVTVSNIGIAGSNFTGPSIKDITTTSIIGTSNASDNIIVYVQQKSGTNTTFVQTADTNGQFDIAVTWYTGTNYIAVIQNSTVNTYTVLSSAAVATYDFEPVPDTTKPRINASLNNLTADMQFGKRVNMTANVSDETGLSWCMFIDNQSLPNGAKTYFNFSFPASTTSSMCSQNYTIALATGNVINFTVVVNDTSNNLRMNDTIFTVVASNTAPVIKLNNATGFAVDPVAGGISVILISFNVTDADGVGDINASKAIVNLTLGNADIAQFRFNISDDGTREFGTCYNHTVSTTVVINCTIIMKYYDNASSAWAINVSVQDASGQTGRNDTFVFTYNNLAAFKITSTGGESSVLNFSTIFLNDQNKEAKAPLLLNNTGNNDFDQINITASALIGITTPGEIIAASQFFVNITNGTAGNGMPLSTAAQTVRADGAGLPNATLLHGPGISGDSVPYPGVTDFKTKGNQSLIFWVDAPASGLSSQTYNNTWNMTVVDLS